MYPIVSLKFFENLKMPSSFLGPCTEMLVCVHEIPSTSYKCNAIKAVDIDQKYTFTIIANNSLMRLHRQHCFTLAQCKVYLSVIPGHRGNQFHQFHSFVQEKGFFAANHSIEF